MRYVLLAAVLVALSGPVMADDYRIKVTPQLALPPGVPPPTVYGQEQNQNIRIQRVPELKPYQAPKLAPPWKPAPPKKLEDYR